VVSDCSPAGEQDEELEESGDLQKEESEENVGGQYGWSQWNHEDDLTKALVANISPVWNGNGGCKLTHQKRKHLG
jgi:hypothetical protein